MTNVETRTRDCVALAFASFFPVCMASIYFIVLRDTTDRSVLAAFSVGKAIQFLFPVAFVFWFYREHLRFVWPSWHGMPLGVGFALAVGLSMFALYYFWVRHIPAVRDDTPGRIYAVLQKMERNTPTGFLMMALFVCIPHSFMEEYYWRWFVFGWMRRHTSLLPAIVLSSAGFMLHHIVVLGVYFPGHFWTLAIPFSVCVAVGGGMWAWIYERSGTLYAPWVSHALIDGAIMAIGYVMLAEYWQ